MRSHAARCSIAAASAALLLTSLTACQPPTARSGEPVHCNVMLDPPTRDNPTSPKTIVSQVRYWCEDPGASRLNLTLRMQKQNASGVWVSVVTTSFVVSGRQTVRTDADRYRTRTLSIRCAEGNFRTTVAGAATGADTKATTYDLIGARSFDPCTPGLQFR